MKRLLILALALTCGACGSSSAPTIPSAAKGPCTCADMDRLERELQNTRKQLAAWKKVDSEAKNKFLKNGSWAEERYLELWKEAFPDLNPVVVGQQKPGQEEVYVSPEFKENNCDSIWKAVEAHELDHQRFDETVPKYKAGWVIVLQQQGGQLARKEVEGHQRQVDYVEAELARLEKKCREMELNFRSQIDVTYLAGSPAAGTRGHGTFATQFKIRLVVDPATSRLTGTGQLTYYMGDYSEVFGMEGAGKCTTSTTGTTHGAPVTVKATRFIVPHGPGSKPDIELEINLGYSTEDYFTRCTPAVMTPKNPRPNMHWWDNGFFGSHVGEFRGERIFVVTFDQATVADATPTLAGIIKREWKRTLNPAFGSVAGVQTIIYDEDTTITLVQVPKK